MYIIFSIMFFVAGLILIDDFNKAIIMFGLAGLFGLVDAIYSIGRKIEIFTDQQRMIEQQNKQK